MLLKIEERWIKTKRYCNRGKQKFIAVLQCDFCATIFERAFLKTNDYSRFVFCKTQCDNDSRKKGNILYNSIISTNQQTYGAKFGSCTSSIKLKAEQTNLNIYGFKASSQSSQVEEKRLNTCILKYGGPAATSSSIVRNKVINTCENRYGGGVLLDKTIREKFNHTMMVNHGVNWAAQSEIIFEKQKETNITRYGVKHPFLTSESKKCAHSDAANKKSHQTKKRNNSFHKSKPEDELYKELCWYFDESDVERQAMINNRWPIDFYIKSINTYVQYDSYWHGYKNGILRNIDEVKEFKTKQDKGIYIKMQIDIEQNVWFKEQNLKLVRIICDEYTDENLLINKICFINN